MLRFCGRRVVCGVARKIFGSIKTGYIGYIRNIRIAGVFSAVLLTIILAMAFFPISKKVEGANAAKMSPNTLLGITSVSNMANVEIELGDDKGAFAASNSNIAFDVTTNNLTGYTLMIADNGNAGKLLNTDNDDVIDTLATVTDIDTFEHGAAETYSNRWGFKPNKYNSLDNVDYVPAPIADTKTILNVTECANGTINCSDEKDSYTIGIGARVDYNRSEGVYTNTYSLVALANVISYEINFLDNTSDDTVADLPDTESGTDTSIAEYTLPTATPTRAGYTFNAWCLGDVTHVASDNSTCDGTVYHPGDSYKGFNDPVNLANIINFYAMWNVKSYNITIKAATGISAVILNGVYCNDKTSGCLVSNLVFGRSYNIEAVMDTGYIFSGWNTGAYGTVVDGTSQTTQYIVGAGDSTITPTTTADGYTIIVKTGTGVSKITLNGVECKKETGSCSITGLLNGVEYDLTATTDNGYTFSGWSGGTPGTIANTSSATTKYTVGSGASTITATATINTYIVNKQYRLQNADGTYPSTYTADGTVTVNHGSTTTYTRAATASHQQASKISATITGNGTTISLDVPRNTYIVTKQYRLQNADGTYPSTYSTDGSVTVRYGDSTTYSRAATTSHQAASKNSGSITAAATISLDVPRNTYTCKISYKYQNADGSYGSAAVAVNTTKRYGEACSWSTSSISGFNSTAYNANSYTNNNITANVDTTVSITRKTFTCKISYKYQNADGSYGSATPAVNTTKRYGEACSWSTSNISGFNSTAYNAASYSNSNTNVDTTVSITRKTFTCKISYKYQNADGSYGSAAPAVNTTKRYGEACSWSYTANESYNAVSFNKSNTNVDTTLSISRKLYQVTVNSGSGSGSYRWGQSVSISASAAATGKHFTSWSVSNATPVNASATTTSFTMPKAAVTATANYAWNTYTVKFVDKSGLSSGSMSNQSFTYGTAKALSNNKFTIKGYYFTGWCTTEPMLTGVGNMTGIIWDWSCSGTTYANQKSVSNLTATNGGTVTLYPTFAQIPNCSSSVHPTHSTRPCKMKDGNEYIFGNGKVKAKWLDLFSNGTDPGKQADFNGSIKSGVCPAGFNGATAPQYDTLLKAYGGAKYETEERTSWKLTGDALTTFKSHLGFSSLSSDGSAISIWSRTEYNTLSCSSGCSTIDPFAYRLIISTSAHAAHALDGNSAKWYVLCRRAGS